MCETRSAPRVVLTVCTVLFVVGLLSTVLTIHHPERLRSHRFGGDAIAFAEAVSRYVQGGSLYFAAQPPGSETNLQPYLTRFLYPPVAVWILFPIFVWDRAVAAAIWLVLTCCLFLTVAFHLASRLARDIVPAGPAATMFAGVVTLTLGLWYPFLHHLGVGQVDVLVLSLCYLAAVSRRDRPALAAVALALGTGLKVFPLLLAAYIVVADRGSRRFVAAYALAMVALAVGAVMGFSRTSWEEWAVVTSFKAAEANPYIVNQSVIGTLNRWMGRGGLRPDVELYVGLRTAIEVLVPLAGGVAVWMAARRRVLAPEVLLSAFAVAYALGSPIFWVQSYVLLLPALMLLAREVLGPSLRGGSGRPVIACLLVGALLIQFVVWFDPARGTIWSAATLLVYHRYVVSQLMLVAALVLVFRTRVIRSLPAST